MTAARRRQMQPPTALNVKEQLEATANRFWTSVTMNNDGNDDGIVAKGATKVPGVPLGAVGSSSGSDGSKTKCMQQNPLQFMLTSMFTSCTSGAGNYEVDSDTGAEPVPSLLEHASHSRVVFTKTITPSRSRSNNTSETPATHELTPSPLHRKQTKQPASAVTSALQESSKKLFKNDHDMAQEAISRLRQQHKRDQAEKIVNDSLNGSDVFADTDRDTIQSKNPSLLSANQSTLSGGPSTLSNTLSHNRTISTANYGGTVSSSIHIRAGTVASSMHTRTISSSTVQEPGQGKQKQLSRKSSLQKFISPRLSKKNSKTAPSKTPTPNPTSSKTPAGKAPVPTRQEHSFFPASKPVDAPAKSRRDPRKAKLRRSKGVPKVVTPRSPIRMLKNRDTQRQKKILNASDNDDNFFADFDDDGKNTENRDVNESWDIENDGVSDITQSTVDRMVRAISQHIQVFPEEAANLNRIHSDVTDPAPKPMIITSDKSNTVEPLYFPMVGGDVAGFNKMTPPRKGGHQKGMSPLKFKRNVGSTGTESFSFFTKTTQSTQTNDFANAWKLDEQKFWDTEVAMEAEKDLFKANCDDKNAFKSPSRMTVIKQKRRGGATSTYTSATTATTPTTAFSSPKSRNSQFFPRNDDFWRTDRRQNAVLEAEI